MFVVSYPINISISAKVRKIEIKKGRRKGKERRVDEMGRTDGWMRK